MNVQCVFATVRLVPRDSFGQRVEVVKRAFLNTNVKNLCSIATPTLVAANPHDCGGTIAAACYRLLSASCFSQSSTRIPSFGIDLRRYMGPSIAIRSRRRRSMSSRAHRKLPAPSTIVPIHAIEILTARAVWALGALGVDILQAVGS
eukprot:m.430217 g.430217  ORF g.430217 m.430217 type:complete len:147 (-) comp17130_c0_seq1:80-520(-)